MFQSNAKATGVLEVFHLGPDGELKDHEIVTNLVVKRGRFLMVDAMGPRTRAQLSHMAIGDGTTAAELVDLALDGAELGRVAFDSVTPGTGDEDNKITYAATFGPGEGTGAVTEAAMFNAAADGDMYCRTVHGLKTKDSGDTIKHFWTITVTS